MVYNMSSSIQLQPISTIPIWGAMGVNSEIRRVRTNPEDPMDVINDTQQGTCTQVACFSNFGM